MAVKLIMSAPELTKRIVALEKSAKTMVNEIEFLARSACAIAVKSGNVTPINRLAIATKDVGSRALIRWLDKNGPVKWDKDAINPVDKTKGAFVSHEKKMNAAKELGEDAYAAKLAETPTYVAEQAKSDSNPFTDYDLYQAVKRELAKADKIAADTERKGKTNDNLAGLEGLRGLFNSWPVPVAKEAKAPIAKAKSGKGKSVSLASGEVPMTAH